MEISSKTIIAAALLAALTCSCRKSIIERLVPDTLPDFSVIMDDGEAVNLLTIMGTPTLLATFDTSVQECRKALPLLQTMYDEYGYSVKFVTISRCEGADEIRGYWDAHFLTLPFSAQTDDVQASKFSDEVPCIMVIDRDYKVAARYGAGTLPNAEALRRVLDRVSGKKK